MPEATTVAAPAATATDPKAAVGGNANVNGKTATPTTTTASTAPSTNAEATEEIKVNGKVVKLTKAQLIAAAQKGLFADQRNKSFDVLKGKTEALINALKTPEGLLQVLKDPALGASPKEVFRKLMASDVIDDELKEEMSRWVYDKVVVQAKKTPEEIERDNKLTEYERLKKEAEDRKQKELQAEQTQKVQQIYQAVRAEVTKQILADKTFPQTEGSIRAVIEKLRVMNKKGVPITVESIGKALDFVKKDHVLHQQAILDAIEDPEALVAAIGEARALKISRALVARLQAKAKAAVAETKPAETGAREKTTDRIDKKLGKTPQGYTILNV